MKRCLLGFVRSVNSHNHGNEMDWACFEGRGSGLLKEIIAGKCNGITRHRARSRIGMLDDSKKGSYEDMKRMAKNRKAWTCWMPWTCCKSDYWRKRK